MARGVLFTPSTGQVLRSPYEVSKDQVLFNPEEPVTEIIYYGMAEGSSSSFIPTPEYILANFSKTNGYVGSYYPVVELNPTPRTYSFSFSSNKYIFLCWPDLPSGSTYGSRAINLVRRSTGDFLQGASNPTVYKYQQTIPPGTAVYPDSSPQTPKFAKLTIDGVVYRVWRSYDWYTYYDDVWVYCIP